MSVQGHLRKMKHSLDKKGDVQYILAVVDENYAEGLQDNKDLAQDDYLFSTNINDFLGKKLELEYQGKINCISCGRKTNKSFNQGYCYPCLNAKAQCDVCIIKPELCHFDNGTCRDNDFAQEYCNIKHSIYLSLTSALKIGITRQNQEKTRWVDQGAVQAIRLCTVDRRYHAGLLEVELAKQMTDKTNWRKMLKNEYPEMNLKTQKENVLEDLAELLESASFDQDLDYVYESIDEDADAKIVNIKYPVLEYPEKVKSFNLDKDPNVEGTLMGIKGQYLIFDTGVINLRKYAGYLMEFKW